MLLTLGIIFAALGALNTADAQDAITFGVPRLVDPIHAYGEPDIKIAPNGDVHVSGPAGTGTQHSIWNISKDGGDSFRIVQGLNRNNAPGPIVDKSSLGPGGGDTEIAIARNGKVFYSDLWALVCFTAATTTDSGETVDSNPVGCSHPGADRQWMGVYNPADRSASTSAYTGSVPLNYQVYTSESSGGAVVDRSTDGIVYTSAGTFGQSGDFSNADGNLVVDQKTGKVLSAVGHNPSDNTKFGLGLAIGTPNASGDLTYEFKVVTDTLLGNPELKFPVLAQDTDRNLYIVWSQDAAIKSFDEQGNIIVDCPSDTKQHCFHIYYSYASAADGWTTWSAPKQVDQPPSLTSVFPWVAAGAAGIIDVVWYGTDQRLSPSERKGQAWDVYLSQISGANTSSPAMTQVRATPHHMHYGDICLLGTACIANLGNRNLADFFQVTIDPEGRAQIVYNDTSNGLIQENFPETGDHAGAPLVNILRQSTGMNAWTGQPLTPGENNEAVSSIDDPLGDALVSKPLGGINQPGVDIKHLAISVEGSDLVIEITTEGTSLADAAKNGAFGFAALTVRWQMDNVLYFASVEDSALGTGLKYYAGKVKSVDLCSVSACSPHVLIYPQAPTGGSMIEGTTETGHSLTYKLKVPASLVGLKTGSLLQQLMGFATLSAKSSALPISNAEAEADALPLQVEGTRTFNYHAPFVASSSDVPLAFTGREVVFTSLALLLVALGILGSKAVRSGSSK